MTRTSPRLSRFSSLAAGVAVLAATFAFVPAAGAQAPFKAENIQLRGNFAAPILVDERVPFVKPSADDRQGGGAGGDKVNYYPVSGNWDGGSLQGSFDIYQNSYGQYVIMYYRVDSGVPSWYISDNAYLVSNALTSVPLYKVRWDYSTGTTKPLIQVGTVTLSLTSNTSGTFSWSVFGLFGSGTFNATYYGGSGRTGMYYPGSTPGLGAMMSASGSAILVNFAYYDGSGNPIWARGYAANAAIVYFWMYEGTSSNYVGIFTYYDSGYPGYYNANLSIPNFTFTSEPFYPLAF